MAGQVGEEVAPPWHGVGLVASGDLARFGRFLLEQVSPGTEVVVLDPAPDLRGADPFQASQALLDPVLQEQVVGHRQFVIGRQPGLEGQHPEEAQVLIPEHGVGDPTPGTDRVRPGVDEGRVLEVLVGALLDGVDAQQRRIEPGAALRQEIRPVPQPFAQDNRVVVQHGIAGDGFAPDVVLREESGQASEEFAALTGPPGHPLQVQSGEVVGPEKGHHLGLGPLLRDILPRSRVVCRKPADHAERAILCGGQGPTVLRQVGRGMGMVRGLRRMGREVEVVLELQGRVRLEADRPAVGGTAAEHGHRSFRNPGQQVGLDQRRPRVAHHDLRAVHHAGQEFVLHELVPALLSLLDEAVVLPEEPFAQEQLGSGRCAGIRIGGPHFAEEDQHGPLGREGPGGSFTLDGDRRGGLEWQVQHGQGQQDLGGVVVRLQDAWRQERLGRVAGREIAPESRDGDQVRTLSLQRQAVVVVLGPFLGRAR